MAADNSLTERVLAAVFEVANTLGAGFLEKVYEQSLLEELELQGIDAVSQSPSDRSYRCSSVATSVFICGRALYVYNTYRLDHESKAHNYR